MVFEPTGATLESLIGNADALRLPINIEIARRRPLTTKMWEDLFREMNEAALSTDIYLFDQVMETIPNLDGRQGRDLLLRQTNRFVVTSIDRGSIEIVAAILVAAGWAFKQFIAPGWEKSHAKKSWDDTVSNMIDRTVPILKDQIDYRVIHRLKRLRIKRVAFSPPSDQLFRLAENTRLDNELLYDEPRRIEHFKKEKS